MGGKLRRLKAATEDVPGAVITAHVRDPCPYPTARPTLGPWLLLAAGQHGKGHWGSGWRQDGHRRGSPGQSLLRAARHHSLVGQTAPSSGPGGAQEHSNTQDGTFKGSPARSEGTREHRAFPNWSPGEPSPCGRGFSHCPCPASDSREVPVPCGCLNRVMGRSSGAPPTSPGRACTCACAVSPVLSSAWHSHPYEGPSSSSPAGRPVSEQAPNQVETAHSQ